MGSGISSSIEMISPPREDVMSLETTPKLFSSTLIITFMTGSMRVVPGRESEIRSLNAEETARRAAAARAEGVVSEPKMWA